MTSTKVTFSSYLPNQITISVLIEITELSLAWSYNELLLRRTHLLVCEQINRCNQRWIQCHPTLLSRALHNNSSVGRQKRSTLATKNFTLNDAKVLDQSDMKLSKHV